MVLNAGAKVNNAVLTPARRLHVAAALSTGTRYNEGCEST